MFWMQDARLRRMRALLFRTYCWGLIPIACMVLYLEDGDLLGHSRCTVAALLHLHGTTTAKDGILSSFSELPSCCALPVEANGDNASGGNPVLLYSDFSARCGDGEGEEKDCRSGCVYGMNFGKRRGSSTLSMGAVPLAAYDKWTDPGAPYGSGRYAEICGRINHPVRSGALSIQLTTPFASSNTLLITLPNDPMLLVEARTQKNSEP